MIFIKTIANTLKVFMLFTGFTILFYYAIMWVNLEYQEMRRYDEPEGAALKVTNMVSAERENWMNRLFFFYVNGE
ncbi:YqzK family protein [Metabacillus fastidiosus]|uniref:YqzK family protein n=1 Tax=Metabacillus fastidiosus TaxID=1458 RepID=UPI003D2890AC